MWEPSFFQRNCGHVVEIDDSVCGFNLSKSLTRQSRTIYKISLFGEQIKRCVDELRELVRSLREEESIGEYILDMLKGNLGRCSCYYCFREDSPPASASLDYIATTTIDTKQNFRTTNGSRIQHVGR
ncbi:hypothetical protein XPA_007221 [Xanthoria parietina]